MKKKMVFWPADETKKMIHAGGLWLKQFEEKETEKYQGIFGIWTRASQKPVGITAIWGTKSHVESGANLSESSFPGSILISVLQSSSLVEVWTSLLQFIWLQLTSKDYFRSCGNYLQSFRQPVLSLAGQLYFVCEKPCSLTLSFW